MMQMQHIAKPAYPMTQMQHIANAASRPTYDLWEPPFGGTPYTELT